MKPTMGKTAMTEQEFSTHPFVLTIEHILSMHTKMTADEKNALIEWERTNCGSGGKGTTEWPGWKVVSARLSH